MNFLSVESIRKSFGERVLFEELTFGVDQGQKVAIVAKNGSGKSTLLRCLIGKDSVDEGRIVWRNELRLAFMEQAEELNAEHSILEEIFAHDIPELAAIKAYNLAMRSGDEEALKHAYEEVSNLNAWDKEVEVSKILSVLKLDNPGQLVGMLSGGQKKRVALAKVLIADADFLMLDEPTNHLDLDMIEWLEEYLSKSRSTILMVTHDRYFLEVVCDTILELENRQIFKYKGSFSYYLEKKAERQEQLEATISKAKNQYRKELDWMRRQPKARGTKQKARIDAFHETKSVARQQINRDELDIPVKMERLGTKILELHHVSKRFGDRIILNDFSYNMNRQERLGIVGNNGTGKSTFLRILLEQEKPDSGKVVIGETVVFGYYNQDLPNYDPDKKLIDIIRDVAEFIPLEKGRQMSAAQFLEKFLFPRDMHYQFVRKLSGGELRRLHLMTILMKNPNFLILDEPTNDLDIFVMSVLEDYLRGFEGCLIVVSHDRYFMDKMVDHLFVFSGQGEVKDIIGNYTDFRSMDQKQRKEVKTPLVAEPKTSAPKENKRKLSFKEIQEFNELEKIIEKLEQEKVRLTELISSPDLSNQEAMDCGNKLSTLMSELNDKSDRWLELSEFV